MTMWVVVYIDENGEIEVVSPTAMKKSEADSFVAKQKAPFTHGMYRTAKLVF